MQSEIDKFFLDAFRELEAEFLGGHGQEVSYLLRGYIGICVYPYITGEWHVSNYALENAYKKLVSKTSENQMQGLYIKMQTYFKDLKLTPNTR